MSEAPCALSIFGAGVLGSFYATTVLACGHELTIRACRRRAAHPLVGKRLSSASAPTAGLAAGVTGREPQRSGSTWMSTWQGAKSWRMLVSSTSHKACDSFTEMLPGTSKLKRMTLNPAVTPSLAGRSEV
jgi:hypothetical protein